ALLASVFEDELSRPIRARVFKSKHRSGKRQQRDHSQEDADVFCTSGSLVDWVNVDLLGLRQQCAAFLTSLSSGPRNESAIHALNAIHGFLRLALKSGFTWWRSVLKRGSVGSVAHRQSHRPDATAFRVLTSFNADF